MTPDAALPPRHVDLRQLADNPPEPPPFIVPEWVPQNMVTLFAGDGGTGKSLLGLQLAVCISAGRHFFGMPVQRRRVAFLSLEDDEKVLHWRVSNICKALNVDLGSLADWLIVWDGERSEGALAEETAGGLAFTPLYHWVRLAMSSTGAEVLVLDNASEAFDGNENARRLVRRFMRGLRALLPPTGAIVLLAHVDKTSARSGAEAKHAYSGSTAWNNSARSRWFLAKDEDGSLVLGVEKSNHATAGAQIRLAWNPETQVFDGTATNSGSSAVCEGDNARDAEERSALFEIIRLAHAEKNPIPTATRGRSAYEVATARGLPRSLQSSRGRKRFYAHIEYLRAVGAIDTESVRRPNRNYVEVLRPASSATEQSFAAIPASSAAAQPSSAATL